MPQRHSVNSGTRFENDSLRVILAKLELRSLKKQQDCLLTIVFHCHFEIFQMAVFKSACWLNALPKELHCKSKTRSLLKRIHQTMLSKQW